MGLREFDLDGLISKLVTGAVLGLLTWVVVSVQDMKVQQAIAVTKLSQLENLANTGFPRTEAIILQEKLHKFEKKLNNLEELLRERAYKQQP